jgi:hypothetical protein
VLLRNDSANSRIQIQHAHDAARHPAFGDLRVQIAANFLPGIHLISFPEKGGLKFGELQKDPHFEP